MLLFFTFKNRIIEVEAYYHKLITNLLSVILVNSKYTIADIDTISGRLALN